MDMESVKRLLERRRTTGNDENDGKASAFTSSIDDLTFEGRFFEALTMQGIKIVLLEPGRVLCSMKIPARLLNPGNSLDGGAIASLVDVVGSAAIFTVGSLTSGVSVEISVSYLDSAILDEEIEIEAKVLRVGKAVGVVSVELRKKMTGKLIAQGRHTKYLVVSSKL